MCIYKSAAYILSRATRAEDTQACNCNLISLCSELCLSIQEYKGPSCLCISPHWRNTEEEWNQVKNRYDKNGDGRLSKKELRDAFNSLGSYFPGWRAWRALHYADSDGDGYISDDEYNNLVNYCRERGYAFK
ncbi:putative Calcium-binding EF-hand family protein [Melia azedarach]|uniref:Calcium-binding EF-hand family protein n=1 Tax=Melia azedarach TaxID=155640 RepID=A0ACC1Y172_MELAZ|nr:putative Calcium-binding EF-hand family protein [Melia azedarach]